MEEIVFDPTEDSQCPYCGSEEFYSDLVQEETGEGEEIRYDIIYCPQCKRRIWEEDHD